MSQKKEFIRQEFAKREDELIRSMFKPKTNKNYRSKYVPMEEQQSFNYWQNQSSNKNKLKVMVGSKNEDQVFGDIERQSQVQTATLKI